MTRRRPRRATDPAAVGPATLAQCNLGDDVELEHEGHTVEVTIMARFSGGWFDVFPVELAAGGRQEHRIILRGDTPCQRTRAARAPANRAPIETDPLRAQGGCLSPLLGGKR
jgi:hypothetical protein